MTIINLIKESGSKTIIIIVSIVIIIIVIIINYLKVNRMNLSDNQIRDNSVQNKSQIEKMGESTIQNVKTTNEAEKIKVTLYYTEWCGYSKMFIPEWKLIQKTIKETPNLNTKVKFEEFDCDISKNICYANNINGYPSITIHKPNGTVVNYPSNYPRKSDLVIDFITKNV